MSALSSLTTLFPEIGIENEILYHNFNGTEGCVRVTYAPKNREIRSRETSLQATAEQVTIEKFVIEKEELRRGFRMDVNYDLGVLNPIILVCDPYGSVVRGYSIRNPTEPIESVIESVTLTNCSAHLKF